MAVRLATIRVVGRLSIATTHIELEDIEWGIKLSRASGDLLVREAADKIFDDNMSRGESVIKVIDAIKKHKKIAHSDLLRKLQKSMDGTTLNKILTDLVQSQTIVEEIKHAASKSARTSSDSTRKRGARAS